LPHKAKPLPRIFRSCARCDRSLRLNSAEARQRFQSNGGACMIGSPIASKQREVCRVGWPAREERHRNFRIDGNLAANFRHYAIGCLSRALSTILIGRIELVSETI